MTRNEVRIVYVHAGIVITVVVLTTILALDHIMSSAGGIYYTALGFSGAKVSSVSGRRRTGDE